MSFFRHAARAIIVIPILALVIFHVTNPLLGKWEAVRDGNGSISSMYFAKRLEFSYVSMRMEGVLADGATPVLYWPSFDQWNVIFLNGNSLSIKVEKDRLFVSVPLAGDAAFQRVKS